MGAGQGPEWSAVRVIPRSWESFERLGPEVLDALQLGSAPACHTPQSQPSGVTSAVPRSSVLTETEPFMSSKPAAPPYPETDAPGTPGGMDQGAVAIRPYASIPASRATPSGSDLGNRPSVEGVASTSGGPSAVAGRRGPDGAALLENYANNSSPLLTCDDARDLDQVPEHDHRTRRYLRRAGLWPLTGLERLAKCGRCRTSGYVALRFVGGVSGFAGLATCGSVWVCPVCAAKIAARRQLEIQAAICAWYVAGGRVAFSTFTMRHQAGDGLQTLWDALQGAWGALTSGAPWGRAKDRSGLAGWLRLVEVTLGPNGWHVHIHALMFVGGKATTTTAGAFFASMQARWVKGVTAAGYTAPLSVAQDHRLVTDGAVGEFARYFSKAVDHGPALTAAGNASGVPEAPARTSRGSAAHAVALEFTQNQTKGSRSRLGTVPPWRLLDLVLIDGDADALDAWHEWERGSKGRRQITWSQGLRDSLGLTVEKSDEDVAAEELSGSDLLLITSDGWREMVVNYWLIPQLLTVTEAGGLHAARNFLDAHGIDYEELG